MPVRSRRREVLTAAVVAALLLTGAAAGSTTRVPRLAVCGAGEVRPDYVLLGCGDGGQFLAGVRWSAWTATGATGTAVWWRNLCTPDCAAGHFQRVPVKVRLSRARNCGAQARRLFTRMRLLPRGDPAVTVRVPTLGMHCP